MQDGSFQKLFRELVEKDLRFFVENDILMSCLESLKSSADLQYFRIWPKRFHNILKYAIENRLERLLNIMLNYLGLDEQLNRCIKETTSLEAIVRNALEKGWIIILLKLLSELD